MDVIAQNTSLSCIRNIVMTSLRNLPHSKDPAEPAIMLPYGSDKRADSSSDSCFAMWIRIMIGVMLIVRLRCMCRLLAEEWRPVPQWRGEKTFHPCKKLQAGREQV